MNHSAPRLFIALVATSLFGCAATYKLVPSGTVAVASNAMTVRPSMNWNRIPAGRFQIDQEESWTRNGPGLDSITFVGGIEEGQDLSKYDSREERRIPTFSANMTPPDFVSMIESNYRIRAGVSVFEMTNMQPVRFLDGDGIQIDYDYIGSDDVKRKGRTVLAVIGGKLYMMSLDGTALHYFDAARPEFEAMVAGASAR